MGSLNYKYAGIGTLLNGNKSYGIVTRTISGLRISNVAGAYFIDNCAALLPYSGCRIRLKDSGGKYFNCVLGLRGVAESLGSELSILNNNCISDDKTEANATTGLIKNGTPTVFESTSSDSPQSGTHHLNITTDSLYDGVSFRPLINWQNGKLLKYSIHFKKVSGANITLSVSIDVAMSSESYMQYDSYHTGSGGMPIVYIRALTSPYISNFYLDNLQLKQVLTPSNNGLLLQAAPTVDSGFLYNLASYTYEIWS